ncbi:hypothetical protein L873DRAFT_1151845 [Choiromyces venosus 120613-1]|uniref:F-box domain-containing protein n=1 Tax=Choiromyces venosus 120613-1 TaxID=1336337 RepID=A0A3N4JFV5_9PEZI|nr:hypothetical protein L873DRAFT_1151845 [Choiromyces venosus 120613-1]
MASMYSLPHEIVINIIECMDTPEEIMVFTCVCRSYLQLFRRHRNTIIPRVTTRVHGVFSRVEQLTPVTGVTSNETGAFSAVPNELILMVMGWCLDAPDVISLAMTCRRFYNLYTFNRRAIMKDVKRGVERRFQNLYTL